MVQIVALAGRDVFVGEYKVRFDENGVAVGYVARFVPGEGEPREEHDPPAKLPNEVLDVLRSMAGAVKPREKAVPQAVPAEVTVATAETPEPDVAFAVVPVDAAAAAKATTAARAREYRAANKAAGGTKKA